jgi:hypothetical protein
MTEEREPFDPDAAVQISAALVKAIAEAKVLVDAENFGPQLHDVIQHARELHDLLTEQIDVAEPGVRDRLRAVSDAMRNNVGRLEDLLRVVRRGV